MHVHQINAAQHAAFLAEERRDPITGEEISVGDEVVFCAGCRSAFLRDSWEYLGKQHCRQSRTLPAAPEAKHLKIRRGIGDLLYKSRNANGLIGGSVGVFAGVLSGNIFDLLAEGEWIRAALILALPLSAAYFGQRYSGTPFLIHRNQLVLKRAFGFKHKVGWEQIERVELSLGKSGKKVHRIRFFFKDKERKKTCARIQTEDHDLKSLFWALGHISIKAPVSVILPDRAHLSYLRTVQNRTKTTGQLLLLDANKEPIHLGEEQEDVRFMT